MCIRDSGEDALVGDKLELDDETADALDGGELEAAEPREVTNEPQSAEPDVATDASGDDGTSGDQSVDVEQSSEEVGGEKGATANAVDPNEAIEPAAEQQEPAVPVDDDPATAATDVGEPEPAPVADTPTASDAVADAE